MPPEANENTLAPATPPQLWQGLEEYLDSPAFREAMADEFPEDAAEWTDPVSRRNFVKLMGASLALAGAAGCSVRPAPVRKIVPYTRQPEQMTLGVPLYFATACPVGGYVTGVLARSNEGRPTKIEGNPDHPSSLGGSGVFELASLLDLYDPDRSKQPTRNGSPTTFEEVALAVRKQLYDDRGQPKAGTKLRVLTGAVTSPTLANSLNELFKAFPEARWVQHEPCGQDHVREGSRKALGQEANVSYDFTKADVVVSLDADFLSTGPGHVRYCHDFGSRRRIRQSVPAGHESEYVTLTGNRQMSRLYVVECMPSPTGAVADHRLPLPASQVDAFARALAARLKVAGVPPTGTLPDAAQKWIEPLARDLEGRKGSCVIVAGEEQPPHVHALALAINSALGNIGSTVHVTGPVEVRPQGKVMELKDLVNELKAKSIDALLVLGGTNPAYTAPADLDFTGAMKEFVKRKDPAKEPTKFTFHLGTHQDETAALCEWHVNEAHYLEAWGDGRGHDGTAAIQQPLIAPLYAGKSAIEVLAEVMKAPTREALEMVRATWRNHFTGTKQAGEFEVFWQEAVRSGVVKGSAPAAVKAAVVGDWAANTPPASPGPGKDEFEINFRPDPTLFDGRYANNGWLNELAKPLTKLSWDNAVFVGMEAARRLGIEKEFRATAGERGRTEVSVVEIEHQGRKVRGPVWIVPGHPDNAVTVTLGYGRERAGRVGNNESEPNADGVAVRGFNAFAIRTSGAPMSGPGKVTKVRGRTYYLACLQAHWSMVQKDPLNGRIIPRDPVRRGSAGDYDRNPWFGKVPPTAVGETGAINENVPGPKGPGEKGSGVQNRSGLEYPEKGHVHGAGEGQHDDKAEKEAHEHDHRLHPLTMYHPNDNLYPGAKGTRRWGMAIDLSACNGCNACVMACVSENNTPVVGKHEVTRGHDMFWIRVDRYYEGTVDAPDAAKTYFQPVPCQQCEKAPCEVVCPVGATAHTADGLNDMTYNRCVGTRYCSNNCPYKVRRFNFLTFQDWATESLKLGRNPDVTVRSRGVMEKCTYCVQRIRYAEIAAEREHRPIRDGEVVTACQAACPSKAIVFGDLEDANSLVGKWKAEPSNYGLLAELNTMPRTSYLACVRNPNPEMKQ